VIQEVMTNFSVSMWLLKIGVKSFSVVMWLMKNVLETSDPEESRENISMTQRVGQEVVRNDLIHTGLMGTQLQKAFCTPL
jgi:hypothetical protein